MAYARRVTTAAKDRRDEIVLAAVELLERHGPADMTVRKITAKVGVSRIAVYTVFDSMAGLVAAVVDYGFAALAAEYRTLDEQPTGLGDVWVGAQTTRDFALAHRHLFAVMFAAESFGGYQRTGADLDQGREALRHMHRACKKARASGELPLAQSDWDATRQLWVTIHGYLMLELAGYFALDAEAGDTFAGVISTALIGLGADSGRARGAVVTGTLVNKPATKV